MRLKADGLACTRGGREVFNSVSFGLSSGEAMLVTGRNGAGKSSLLRMIAGLVWISSGRLKLDGGEPDTPLSEQCHYLGHQDAMKPSLSVAKTSGSGPSSLVRTVPLNPLWRRSIFAPRRSSRSLLVSGATPASIDCPPCRRATPNLAAGRAHLRSRFPLTKQLHRPHERSPGGWGNDRRCRARTDRTGTRARTEIGTGMSAFTALLSVTCDSRPASAAAR